MSELHTDHHSHALTAFTRGTEALPYRMPDGVNVVPAKARVRFGSPFKGSAVHIIEAVAVAHTTPERGIVGARWKCGGSSIGATLFDLEQHVAVGMVEDPMDLVCQKCRNVEAGIGPCVYRVWDRARLRLLYIGSTRNFDKRRAQHRRSTWWWHQGLQVEVDHYASIEEARVAEAEAIRTEHPEFNVVHKTRRTA